MINIIYNGPEKYHCACSKCGCVFEYELEDICADVIGHIGPQVTCPRCNDWVSHILPDNGKPIEVVQPVSWTDLAGVHVYGAPSYGTVNTPVTIDTYEVYQKNEVKQ